MAHAVRRHQVVRRQTAFSQVAANDNVPVGHRAASNAALAVSTAALLAGIAIFHSLAVFL